MVDERAILDQIEKLITAVYRERTLVPWDTGRIRAGEFESLFRERLSEWPLRNLTDLEYGSSTALAFLLHPGHYIGVPTRDGIEVLISRLGGHCFQAIVEISHLGPFSRVRFTRETLDDVFGRIRYSEQAGTFREEDTGFYESLIKLLQEQGINVLSEDILARSVPDVELDVTKVGCATIYHCLFDEE